MTPSLAALPEELLLAIFQHVFFLPTGPIVKVRETNDHSKRTSNVDKVMEDSLFLLLGTSKALFRIAQEAFYSNNTVLLRRIAVRRKEHRFPGIFWLPNVAVRHWITCLQITLDIPAPSKKKCKTRQKCRHHVRWRFSCPRSDWPFLKRIADGTHVFLQLRHLVLHSYAPRHFTLKHTSQLGKVLKALGGMSFRVERLTIEAWEGDSVCHDDTRDMALQGVLEGYLTPRNKCKTPC